MSIFDVLDIGASIFSAGMVSKATKKLKAEHPEAYQCHTILGKVCLQSPLDFSAVGSPEGLILYRSEKLVRGFPMPDFKCYAFVLPQEPLIEFVYIPEHNQFVSKSDDARELLNWVNSRLSIGRFYVRRTFTNNVGKEVIELAYSITVNCHKVPHDQLEKVLKNVIDDVLAFREVFIPIIRPVSELTLSYDYQGKLVGQNADQSLGKYQQALSKWSSKFSIGRQEQLRQRLINILDETGNAFEYDSTNQNFIIFPESHDTGNFYLHVYVNQFSQILFQSYTIDFPENQCLAVIHSEYLLYANRDVGGNYHVSRKDRRVIYHTGLDARGIEDNLHNEWIVQMIRDHLPERQINMQGFQYVINQHTSPEQVIEKILSGAPAPFVSTNDSDTEPRSSDDFVDPVENFKLDSPINEPDLPLGTAINSPQPTVGRRKSRTVALLLEILPAFIGLLGLGWLYSGRISVGLPILFGMIIVDAIALGAGLISAGIGIFCLFPFYLLVIGISAFKLNNYTKQHPEIFGS